jgi:hypothetical protein
MEQNHEKLPLGESVLNERFVADICGYERQTATENTDVLTRTLMFVITVVGTQVY